MNLYMPTAGFVEIEMYNSSGQNIMQLMKTDLSSGSHQIHADVSSLSSGVYYFKIKTNKKIITNKIIIIK
jgi:hypothetical protein